MQDDRFKVGDLVRNTHEDRERILPDEGLGIVLQLDLDHDYQQLKVATSSGITYWWPAVVELADESR